ncbi:restriction endonuclease [Mucilaginibacter sp. RS28]|uniref:Restriction endonuclease n=1 Tax=Mucilaginibacter straminoryzae TaxID=2932774 RepID=A0A9X1X647_9SPHI|nr:restriction endonuclease [Mucilaginibacter straminoryzae]MCJ8210820.1 restriction endonuclease [Mucilaginibacter straminoryzae]
MKRRTIREAIIETLNRNLIPLSAKEIYTFIVTHDLYRFNAAHPENIVRIEIRRHCAGVDFPTAKPNKVFQIHIDGKYSLINSSSSGIKVIDPTKVFKRDETFKNQLISTVNDLEKIHEKHCVAFKDNMLYQLKSVEPKTFEIFAKRLLEAYGFVEMLVTNYVKDGGLDGHGKLKVGITHLNVAFQCKRWRNNTVSRTEIDKFRGAIQGDYEQGIIFTTSTFSKEALNATRKRGAVPIILIDGNALIDIMIEKKFGVDIDMMPVYVNALDQVLNDETD